MQDYSAIGKELLVDAARYWEPMRIAYNGILASASIVCWAPEIFSGRVGDLLASLVVLMFFAVPANLCYCAAYPIDLMFQLTPFRRYRQSFRWALLLCGTCLAVGCALWVLLVDHMG